MTGVPVVLASESGVCICWPDGTTHLVLPDGSVFEGARVGAERLSEPARLP